MVKKWCEEHKYDHPRKILIGMEMQTEEKVQTSQSTQTIGDDKNNIAIETTATYIDWIEIADREWDESTYTNTETKEGSPLNVKDSTVKVIVTNAKDKNMEQGLQKVFKDQYPELGEPMKILKYSNRQLRSEQQPPDREKHGR